MIRAIGLDVSDSELKRQGKKILKKLDSDGSGLVEFDEYVACEDSAVPPSRLIPLPPARFFFFYQHVRCRSQASPFRCYSRLAVICAGTSDVPLLCTPCPCLPPRCLLTRRSGGATPGRSRKRHSPTRRRRVARKPLRSTTSTTAAPCLPRSWSVSSQWSLGCRFVVMACACWR